MVASFAMQGLLASGQRDAIQTTEKAFEIADHMMKRLNKDQEPEKSREAQIIELKEDLNIHMDCPREWNEKKCDGCKFIDYEMVSHPGGSSVHSVKKHFCKIGHWKEDF